MTSTLPQDSETTFKELIPASRLRRISDRMFEDVSALYTANNLDFNPRWMPYFSLLQDGTPRAVMEIATLLRVSHPTAIKFTSQMIKAGLLASTTDKAKRSRRLLALTQKGKTYHSKLEPILGRLLTVFESLKAETGDDLPAILDRLEAALDRSALNDRYQTQAQQDFSFEKDPIEIVPYEPLLAKDFERLNREWIETHFVMEPEDEEMLRHPERIVDSGGVILFARYQQKVIGTFALIESADDFEYELAKMAVDPAYRGKGVGNRLMEAVLKEAQVLHAKRLFLVTNHKLVNAIHLYEKYGFEHFTPPPHLANRYARGDVNMELYLNPF